ncbi:MAG: hypothetical protein F6K26_34105 [Moorea sp. SIO2I5]|nr:hypothetical protein [Moorena sp. SIO2I5]
MIIFVSCSLFPVPCSLWYISYQLSGCLCQAVFFALLNNGIILILGALSNGRVNRPWVAPVEQASCLLLIF